MIPVEGRGSEHAALGITQNDPVGIDAYADRNNEKWTRCLEEASFGKNFRRDPRDDIAVKIGGADPGATIDGDPDRCAVQPRPDGRRLPAFAGRGRQRRFLLCRRWSRAGVIESLERRSVPDFDDVAHVGGVAPAGLRVARISEHGRRPAVDLAKPQPAKRLVHHFRIGSVRERGEDLGGASERTAEAARVAVALREGIVEHIVGPTVAVDVGASDKSRLKPDRPARRPAFRDRGFDRTRELLRRGRGDRQRKPHNGQAETHGPLPRQTRRQFSIPKTGESRDPWGYGLQCGLR